MAINFNGTTYSGTNSGQNVNFNGTNMCGVLVDPPTGYNYVAFLRERFVFYSNNYANLDYRIWVNNVNTGQICYCWRTCSQDSDSYICHLDVNLNYSIAASACAWWLLRYRNDPNQYGHISFCGNCECSANVYGFNIGTGGGYTQSWVDIATAAGSRTTILPTAASSWFSGEIYVPVYIAQCFYYRGMSCTVDRPVKWIPQALITCIRNNCDGSRICSISCAAGYSTTYCTTRCI